MNDIAGLSWHFCRYLDLLDKTLPEARRKDDGQAASMVGAIAEVAKIDPEASGLLEAFLDACHDFRAQQYGPDPRNRNRDFEQVWLPIVLLGASWQAGLHTLLGYDLPDKLGRATFVRLRPGAANAPARLSVEIRPELAPVSEEMYGEFEHHVKRPFGLRTSYDIDNGVVRILEPGCIVSPADSLDAGHLLAGQAPEWVSLLLDLDGVVAVEVEYPIQRTSVPALHAVVAAVLAVPHCPNAWRSGQADTAAALEQIRGRLQAGKGPFFLMITKNGPEFYPLVNHYARQLLDEQSRFAGIASDGGAGWPSITKHAIARRLSLPAGADIRDDTEYHELRRWVFAESPAAKDTVVPDKMFLLDPVRADHELLERIGNADYLDAVVRHLQDLGRGLLEKLGRLKAPDNGEGKPPLGFLRSKELQGIQRNARASSLGLAMSSLQTLLNSLNVIQGMFSTLSEDDRSKHKREWDWLLAEERQGNGFEEACRWLLKVAIENERRETREQALAAVLYVLNPLDVISDSPIGLVFLDDEAAAAKAVVELSKDVTIPKNVGDWARRCLNTLDERIDGDTQAEIEKQVQQYRQKFKAL